MARGSARRGPIVVIGSINMDLVCRAARLPRPGETVMGSELTLFHGGKGANQAVAAARLGGEVHLVGRVGDDDFGARLIDGLRRSGVHTGAVRFTRGVPSGAAVIVVGSRGENSIVVAPGANASLAPEDVDRAAKLIGGASSVVLQLETPLATVRHAVALCRRLRVFSILDPAPAPARGLPADLERVDLLTPNEREAEALLGRRAARLGAQARARALLRRGAGSVALKLGERGALALGRDGKAVRVPAFRVEAVDTTAAGDAFTAALAVGRGEGMALPEALRLACAAAALTCTVRGAQPALPRRVEVERLLAAHARPQGRGAGRRRGGAGDSDPDSDADQDVGDRREDDV